MTSRNNCTLCPAGFYCKDRGLTAPSGMCKAGHICFGGALGNDPVYNDDASGNKTIITWGDTCHAGYYCPQGTTFMVPCPRGTYNPDRGGTSAVSCKSCDPGKYCNGTALIQPTDYCTPGYYCTGNASVPNPLDGVTGNICPAYSFCDGKAPMPTACTIGFYANTTGASQCMLCLAGYLCYSGQAPTICPQGQ